jgi:hypothetical protein
LGFQGSGLEKDWVQVVPAVLRRCNSLPYPTTSPSPKDAKIKGNELHLKFNILEKAKFARRYPPAIVSGKKGTVSRWSENPYKIISKFS